MNHLESGLKGKNSIWRYIVMFVVILVVSNTIGAIPLFVALISKSSADPGALSSLSANPSDLSAIGLDQNIGLAVMLFPFIAGLVAFALLVMPLNKRSLKDTINGNRMIRWSHFVISAIVWFLLSGLYLIFYLKIDPANFVINNNNISILILIAVSVLLIPFQATFEEVLFRGYLMQGVASLVKNRWAPILITSLLFGLMHAFNPEIKEFGFLNIMPQYILFGLLFGVITIMDDGIEAAMGAHAANNIFLCVMVTNKSSALQTPALFEQYNISPWFELAGLFITGVILIVVLSKIFRWNSFSQLFTKIPN